MRRYFPELVTLLLLTGCAAAENRIAPTRTPLPVQTQTAAAFLTRVAETDLSDVINQVTRTPVLATPAPSLETVCPTASDPFLALTRVNDRSDVATFLWYDVRGFQVTRKGEQF